MALSVTSAPWQQVAEPALDLRRQLSYGRGEGVVGFGSMAVVQRAAGANMSVDVSAGEATVRGDSITYQGLYHVVNDAVVNVTGFTAANATNPRIDRVVLRIQDAFHGDAANSATFEILTGTATAGATLTNLTGATAVGNGRLLLANILVPATATTITTANIDTTVRYAPPSNPVDGEMWDYLADATNGVVWRFKYNAGSASAYKWEFIGGPSSWKYVDAQESTATTSVWLNLATPGPLLNTPRAGDYLVRFGALIGHSAVGAVVTVGVAIGDGTPGAPTAQFYVPQTNYFVSVASEIQITGVSAAADLKLRYHNNTTGTMTALRRFISVTPIRVN